MSIQSTGITTQHLNNSSGSIYLTPSSVRGPYPHPLFDSTLCIRKGTPPIKTKLRILCVALRRRAEKVYSLSLDKLIPLSVSHILVITSVIALLSLNLANYFSYGQTTRLFIAGWALLLLFGSYLLYSSVKRHVDLLDYLGSLIFYHKLRVRSKELDRINTVLFLGLLLITFSPFLYTYLNLKGYPTMYAMIALLLGGVMIALAVSSYVLLEEIDKS